MNRPVNVIPSREARQHLGSMLDRFRRGEREPMVFGAHRKPEAVIVSFDDYLRFLELEERAAAETAAVTDLRERIAQADAGDEKSQSVEELVDELGLGDLLESAPRAANG
jgi:PHD/YefM family antitoxin component YafN of YafNO toxin-antitoxin module